MGNVGKYTFLPYMDGMGHRCFFKWPLKQRQNLKSQNFISMKNRKCFEEGE